MLHVYFWSDKPLNMFSLPMMKICHEIKEATVCMRENEKIKAFSDGLGTRNNTAYHTQNAVEKKIGISLNHPWNLTDCYN